MAAASVLTAAWSLGSWEGQKRGTAAQNLQILELESGEKHPCIKRRKRIPQGDVGIGNLSYLCWENEGQQQEGRETGMIQTLTAAFLSNIRIKKSCSHTGFWLFPSPHRPACLNSAFRLPEVVQSPLPAQERLSQPSELGNRAQGLMARLRERNPLLMFW